jgi:hypothetical protein
MHAFSALSRHDEDTQMEQPVSVRTLSKNNLVQDPQNSDSHPSLLQMLRHVWVRAFTSMLFGFACLLIPLITFSAQRIGTQGVFVAFALIPIVADFSCWSIHLRDLGYKIAIIAAIVYYGGIILCSWLVTSHEWNWNFTVAMTCLGYGIAAATKRFGIFSYQAFTGERAEEDLQTSIVCRCMKFLLNFLSCTCKALLKAIGVGISVIGIYAIAFYVIMYLPGYLKSLPKEWSILIGILLPKLIGNAMRKTMETLIVAAAYVEGEAEAKQNAFIASHLTVEIFGKSMVMQQLMQNSVWVSLAILVGQMLVELIQYVALPHVLIAEMYSQRCYSTSIKLLSVPDLEGSQDDSRNDLIEPVQEQSTELENLDRKPKVLAYDNDIQNWAEYLALGVVTFGSMLIMNDASEIVTTQFQMCLSAFAMSFVMELFTDNVSVLLGKIAGMNGYYANNRLDFSFDSVIALISISAAYTCVVELAMHP